MSTRGERGRELLANATSKFEELKSQTHDPDVQAISDLRVLARSAMDWLEEGDDFEAAHQLVDRIGGYVRTNHPESCKVHYESGTYYDTCPVLLGHSRVGLSPGLIIRESKCSICDEDPWTCDHISGETYEGERAYRIVTRADILEVSLVARPAQPDARITKASIDESGIRQALGAEYVPGMTLFCDRCLTSCPGLNRAAEATRRLPG